MTQFKESWETAQEGLRVPEEANDLERRSELLTMPVPLHHMREGDLDAAVAAAEEGYALAMRLGLMYPPPEAAFMLANLYSMRGEYEAALQAADNGIATSRPLAGFVPFLLAMNLGVHGGVYLEISEKLAPKAQESHGEALELLESPFGAVAGGSAWPDIGFSRLALGDHETAARYFQSGLTTPSYMMYLMRPRMLAGVAFVALAQGKAGEAAVHADEATRYAEERGMRYFYPLVYLARGSAHLAAGDSERALERFEAAAREATYQKQRPALWQAQAAAADALDALGRQEEASSKREAAHRTIAEIAALFRDPQLCGLFTESARSRVSRLALQPQN
jgi:tetratricopeptide (TPR) repeat protein